MNDKRIFVLRDNDVKRRMVEFAASLPMEPLMECTFKPFVKKRSLQQNSAYWGVWLPAIRQMILDSFGDDNTPEALHEYFKDKFIDPEFVQVMGEVKAVRKTTTKMSVKEMMAFTENIEHWCIENLDGFHLPPLITNDYGG